MNQELEDLFQQGIKSLQEKKYAESLEMMKVVDSESPDDTAVLFYLGYLYIALGNYEKCLSSLTRMRTITKDSMSMEAWFLLALSLRVLGRNKEAEPIYDRLLAENSESLEYFFQFILNQIYLRGWKKALPVAKKAEKLFPDDGRFLGLRKMIEFFERGEEFLFLDIKGKAFKFAITGKLLDIELPLFSNALYEPKTTRLVLDNFSGGVFLDVGASTGYYTLIASVLCNASKVIPFEINPVSVEALKKSVIENELTNIDFSFLGFPLSNGRAKYAPAAEGDLSIGLVKGGGDDFIQSRSLDELEIEEIDFLKVDIDGIEVEFLKGAKETLYRCKPKLAIEVARETKDEAFAILDSLDFTLVNSWGPDGKVDCFFVPSQS